MRILFVGTVQFSRHCLNEILKEGGNVVAALTLPKKRAGFHSDYADLTDVALQFKVPLFAIQNINDPRSVGIIRSFEADVIFVFGWSQIISKAVLDIPPLGCIGTHPALLPRNRGRHPIVWALIEALEESGLTFFYMDEGVDSGDILWQKPFRITLKDDAGTLYEKIKCLASEAIREFLPLLEQGEAPRIPQDHSKATYWRKRAEKDGTIHWAATTMQTYNLIRALTRPYVGAQTFLKGHKVIIWRSRLPTRPLPVDAVEELPGRIFAGADEGWAVRTGDGYIHVSEWEAFGPVTLSLGQQF